VHVPFLIVSDGHGVLLKILVPGKVFLKPLSDLSSAQRDKIYDRISIEIEALMGED
jgi:hypothetical protein